MKLSLIKCLAFGLGLFSATSALAAIQPDYFSCKDYLKKSSPEACNDEDGGAYRRGYCGYIVADEAGFRLVAFDTYTLLKPVSGTQFSDELLKKLKASTSGQIMTKFCVTTSISVKESEDEGVLPVDGIEDFTKDLMK